MQIGKEETKLSLLRDVWLSNIESPKMSQVPVVHTCNPSYLGGRDQEDPSSKPAWAIVHGTLSQKTLHKKGLVE
jgi:hypothetical protein